MPIVLKKKKMKRKVNSTIDAENLALNEGEEHSIYRQICIYIYRHS